MEDSKEFYVSKVPQLTLIFWIIKIAATTLGETGGDAVTMSWLGETTDEGNGMGYLIGTAIFGAIFLVAVLIQIKAEKFHPFLYWLTIVATTTVGTTLADFATRSLGIGYPGGSLVLLALLTISLVIWRWVMGTVSVASVSTPRAEIFYWVTILFSQTLGTALGDWIADDTGLGYLGAAILFGGILAATVALYFWTNVSRTVLFWIAFVVTRPLGAVLGDFLDKPMSKGGLELSRTAASVVLLVFMIACILIFEQKPAEGAH